MRLAGAGVVTDRCRAPACLGVARLSGSGLRGGLRQEPASPR